MGRSFVSIGSRLPRTSAALLSVAPTGAWASEYGRVVSATPIAAAVPVPQRECIDRPVVYAQPNSGVGALIGAITGAAIGSNVGGGTGRAAAAAIGLIAGSVIGDRVEGCPAPAASTVRQCWLARPRSPWRGRLAAEPGLLAAGAAAARASSGEQPRGVDVGAPEAACDRRVRHVAMHDVESVAQVRVV
jgi:hypothetical protein